MRSKGTSEVKSSSSMAVTQGHRHKATKLSEVRDFQEPLVVLSERPSGINYIKSAIFLTFFFFISSPCLFSCFKILPFKATLSAAQTSYSTFTQHSFSFLTNLTLQLLHMASAYSFSKYVFRPSAEDALRAMEIQDGTNQ